MLRAMRGSTLERRAFVTLMGQALVGAGVLAISRPDPVPARDRDPNVFAGQETFEQLLVLGRERAWRELPIGERIGAIGMAPRETPYVAATRQLYHDREVCWVNFMSTHPEAYRQLTANPDLVRKIARVEAEINARELQYVPREKVAAAQPRLMTGDIIGVTTTIDGLDCAHAGFCYRDEGGTVRLLHASTTQKAVLLDEELATYLARVPTHTGIMVARPLEVA